MKDVLKYALGEIVYSSLDVDNVYIIVGVIFRSNGHSYIVSNPEGEEVERYEVELTRDKEYKFIQEEKS